MREIKFRGMGIDGTWHYGNVSILPERVMDVKAGTYISNKAGCPFAYEVRNETVGQYIGSKDCKNIEMFEGDIVKKDNKVGYIRYGRGHHYVVEIGINGAPIFGEWEELEIIGNIHENKEKTNGNTGKDIQKKV